MAKKNSEDFSVSLSRPKCLTCERYLDEGQQEFDPRRWQMTLIAEYAVSEKISMEEAAQDYVKAAQILGELRLK